MVNNAQYPDDANFDPTNQPGPYDLQKIKGYVDNPSTYGDFYKSDSNTYLAVPVYQAFMANYGRAPTQQELNIWAPQVATLGHGGAQSAIAQAAYAEQHSPDKIHAQQQAGYAKAAPEHYDQVNQTVQSLLGRSATQDELSHFGALLASGQADPYQLQSYFQSTPEYQQGQDQKFRSGLNTELQGYDKQFFNTAKEDVISRYAQMGRSTSPALDVALTDLQAQINERRGNYLATLSASQYGGNKSAAMGDYAQTQSDANARNNMDLNARYNDVQNMINRGQQVSDYNTMANAYANSAPAKRSPGMGAAYGAASGAAAGTAILPGWGTAGGALVGGALGYLSA